jgi:hypothetical protein
MTTTPKALAEHCRETVALANRAAEWLGDEKNADTVGRVRDSLVKTMRRASIRAVRLEKAALRPMCVGVFGPSQAGKSYLVEVIARPETGVLRARFDGLEPLDFLAEINPPGEKESTGLVTRFTSRRAEAPCPPGFPVRLRLLTETDILKTLGNTFFLDGDQTKEDTPSAKDIADTLSALRDRANRAGAASGALDEDAVLDVQDYFRKHFDGARYLEALAPFWSEAQLLAPRLDLEGRARLFGLLWGRHEPLSELYRELARALERLGRPEEAFGPIDALVPREGSILDVATLAGLGRASDDLLRIRAAGGGEVELPRAVVAALTAELRVEIAGKPRPFFDETDLLDFPGARSRQKMNLGQFFQENVNALKEVFLRGKVAYLFDRYVAEQELTSMLLCIRPSNQEVVTLPDLVEDWIASTHGRTPEARRDRPITLFFVLTWFDTHFVEKAGEVGQDPGLRFRNRLEASLLGFFGKAHAWPRNWTPGEPFRNCYWFRNPNYPAEAIIRYEGREEAEFLPEKKERIEALRRGFLRLPEASDHFRDPARAFDEALRLNDGGVSYLIENLEQVCRPELKLEQVTARLAELRRDLQGQLGRFYVSLDVQKRLDERRAASGRVFDALEAAVEANTFGSLMRWLLIDPSDLTDVFYAHLRGVTRDEQPKGSVPIRPSGTIVRPERAPPRAAPIGTVARERLLARVAIASWVDRLRAAAEGEAVPRLFGVPSDALEILVGEVVDLVKRTDLEGRIAADLAGMITPQKAEESSAKYALVASIHMNRLMCDLGFSLVPSERRPEVKDEDGVRPAFDTRPIVFDARNIGPTPKPFSVNYVSDWMHGFFKVVEDNATSEQGVKVDLVQNERLKTILDALDAGSAG